MNLENAVCLITGGTKGIGAATALALAQAGANIVIVGRHPEQTESGLREGIEELGRKFVSVKADVSKPAEARECVRETARRLGSVDVLVHSAGGPVPGTFMELTAETWQAAFDTQGKA